MKRVLAITAVMAVMMSACSSEEEPVGELDAPEGNTVLEENYVEAAASDSDEGKRASDNPFEGASEVASNINTELSEAVDNASIQSFEMNDVIIKVMSVERSGFANGTRIDVEYAVENTVKDRRMVPLERTIIVTDAGDQVEYDRDISNLPEWDLVSDSKTEGTVSFYLNGTEPNEVESVDVIVPGVDFKRSDDEMFTIDFEEDK